MSRWAVSVDADACTGSGLCVGCAPAYFELSAAQRSTVIESVVDPDDAISAAAECCPMEAIRVSDAETGELIHPEPIR